MTRVIQQQRVVVQPQPALYQRRPPLDLCQGPEVRGTAEAPESGLGSLQTGAPGWTSRPMSLPCLDFEFSVPRCTFCFQPHQI